ncbi:MAG: DUF4097 domain-containing protein [Rikenellaceae bacterium]|nr:DUF4097 domain-containing protein [Rikenellaceae bacterium]
MRKIFFTPLLLLFCALTAHGAELEKTLNHRFDRATAAGTMSIDASYSDINVIQWNRAYAEVTVTVTAKARNTQNAQRMLDAIDVLFSETGNSASARTDIRNTSSRNDSYEIRFDVSIPAGMKFEVDCKYGNVRLDDHDGDLDATLKYGNLVTGHLASSDNLIDVKYGNVTVSDAQDVQLTLGYGNFSGGTIEALDADTKYSNIRADYVGTLYLSGSRYDKYEIGEAVTVDAPSGSSDMRIRKLYKSIRLSGAKYGNVVIDRVEAGFESIEITASYSNVKIKFADPSFDYELKAKYGRLSLSDMEATTRRQITDHSYSEMVGTAGSGGPTVEVTASYGNVQLSGL